MTSFLQSIHWREFQESLGRTTYTKQGDGWSYLAIKESGTLNTRLYTPYGPTFTSDAALKGAIDSLRALGKEEGATFIRIEPPRRVDPSLLHTYGFQPVSYQQLQPVHTQIIDLRHTHDEILAQMNQNSRNITRNYHKKGVSIRISHEPSDITILTSLLASVARRNDITTHSEDYFHAQAASLLPSHAASLYVAEYQGTPIAAALVYDSDTTRTYAHAAADENHRKLNASTALVGQMILDAKEAGLSQFDLYGVAPTDDPNHPWAGFTRFKKSFGGSPVVFSGAWDLPLRSIRYKLYRQYQSLRRSLCR